MSDSFSCGRLGTRHLGKARFNGRDTVRLRVPRLLVGVRKGKLTLSEISSISYLPLDTYLGGATGTWAVYIRGSRRGKSVVWKFPFFRTLTARGLEKRTADAVSFVHRVGRAAGMAPQVDGRAVVYDRSGRVTDLRVFALDLDHSSSVETADDVFLDDDDSDFDVD